MSLELEKQYEKIYAFSYFKVRNREVAEDITQETFLKYFEATQYLEKGKKLAFLYTIARNCCADYFRKNRPTEDFDALTDFSSQGVEDMEATLAVRVAVAGLPAQVQELVLLRFVNELGIDELAAYLGISRFAVRRRLQAIEKQLRATLNKEDFYG